MAYTAEKEFEIQTEFLFKTRPQGIGLGGGLSKHELER